MPISPSRSTEIRKLVARLAGPSAEDARSAAARLLVIGPPAVPALADLVRLGTLPGSSRAIRLLVGLGDRRGPEILAEVAGSGGALAAQAAELLAAFPDPATVRLLQDLACGAARPQALVALHVLARGGLAEAGAAFSGVLTRGPAAVTPEELLASAEALERRLAALAADPLGDEVPERPVLDPLDAYLELSPDSDAEVAARKETASAVNPEELASRLAAEPDARRASLLALLAAERPHASLILPLRRVTQWAEDPGAAGRDDVHAAAARAHLALAMLGSRVSAVELSRVLDLGPERIRVEHLGALELIGSRTDVPRLAALSGRPDWIGDAAWRVLLQVASREGLTARSPLFRALPPERRKALQRSPGTARRARPA